MKDQSNEARFKLETYLILQERQTDAFIMVCHKKQLLSITPTDLLLKEKHTTVSVLATVVTGSMQI